MIIESIYCFNKRGNRVIRDRVNKKNKIQGFISRQFELKKFINIFFIKMIYVIV